MTHKHKQKKSREQYLYVKFLNHVSAEVGRRRRDFKSREGEVRF